MCNPAPRMTRAQARAILAEIGCTLRRDESGTEWRVNFRNGYEATAYYTPDLSDAVDTARAMVERRRKVELERYLAQSREAAAFQARLAMGRWEPEA